MRQGALAIFSVLLIAGCTGQGTGGAAGTPEEVTKAFVAALVSDNPENSLSYASSSIRTNYGANIAASGGTRTESAVLSSFTLLDQDIRGDCAAVKFEFVLKSASTGEESPKAAASFQLVREGGTWKINSIMQPADSYEALKCADESTPAGVAKSFFTNLVTANMDKAISLSSEKLKPKIEALKPGQPAIVGGFAVDDEKITGDTAVVKFRVQLATGYSTSGPDYDIQYFTAMLVRENGAWKVDNLEPQ